MTNISAERIWALIVKAQIVNGSYVKNAEYKRTDGKYDIDENGDYIVDKRANRELVLEWISGNYQPTDNEIEKGQECRRHFNGYTFLALTGRINDFQNKAMQIASKDQWKYDRYEFGILCSLPGTMERDLRNREIADVVRQSSKIIVDIGERVQGVIDVLKSSYSFNYNTNVITAKMGDSVVEFFSQNTFDVGKTYTIKGKVKKYLDDNRTRLNYVKVVD